MNLDFDKYYEAPEPGRRERAYAWATAIGLQDVDGLKPSKYLLATAKRHIEGEISQEDARRLVDEYYETKLGHDEPENAEEADKVSARMISIINAPGFRLSPEYYLGLHKQIFDGVFPHAGKIRDVELTKREWVLKGDTVQYTPSCVIRDSLDYDFNREKEFSYKGLSEDRFVEHFASFISGVWQIHPFREGNTRTVALFAIKYLRSRGYTVTNDLFAEKSWFFRNALVRANYENDRLNVEKTQLPLEEFFKVLIYGDEIELHNRFLRIGQEYGTTTAKAIADLHRHDDGVLVPSKREQVGEQVRGQVEPPLPKGVARLLKAFKGEMSVLEMMGALKLGGRRNFLEKYLSPAIELGLVEMTQPNSPRSPTQKYRLTEKGKSLQATQPTGNAPRKGAK
jgi:fido (protein-threonine AMPylation protein)